MHDSGRSSFRVLAFIARRTLAPALALALSALIPTSPAAAQNKLDLDDLNVKGDLLNDNRLKLRARENAQTTDRVRYRTNFREEIAEGIEIPATGAPAAKPGATKPAK